LQFQFGCGLKSKNLPGLPEQIFCFKAPEPPGEANCNCS
jgi:hypothetical protein